MHTIVIDKAKLLVLVRATAGKVKYLLGSKPAVTMAAGKIKTSDCSGFARWLLHQVTNPPITIPAGSWYQHQWCKEQGFKLTNYALNASQSDGRLRMAFIEPHEGKPGHVWFVLDRKTIECCGGRGVCRRAWNTAVLKNNVSACYVLTEPLK